MKGTEGIIYGAFVLTFEFDPSFLRPHRLARSTWQASKSEQFEERSSSHRLSVHHVLVIAIPNFDLVRGHLQTMVVRPADPSHTVSNRAWAQPLTEGHSSLSNRRWMDDRSPTCSLTRNGPDGSDRVRHWIRPPLL